MQNSILAETWRRLELGQLIYLGFVVAVSLGAFLWMPYRNPLTEELHWSPAWSPPRYKLEHMEEILTTETMAQLSEIAPPTDGFRENSTTAEMRPQIALHRLMLLATLTIAVIGWFFVPGWIEQLVYRVHKGTRSGT